MGIRVENSLTFWSKQVTKMSEAGWLIGLPDTTPVALTELHVTFLC